MIGSAGMGFGLGSVAFAKYAGRESHEINSNETEQSGPINGLYDVKSFGATGNGSVKDTASIQSAIDTCTAEGGGMVYLPPGTYLTGALQLKNNVEIHLSSGSVLLGSADPEDYNSGPFFNLIFADQQENVSITGQGIIDGNSKQIVPSFWKELPEGAVPIYRYKIHREFNNWSREHWEIAWRPRESVHFFRCKRVNVRDVKMLNAPNWVLLFHRCKDVQVNALTIENPPMTKNGDGINIDTCSNVTLTNCIIRSGDDCLTLKTGESDAKFGIFDEPNTVCENVTISNCVLSTPACAIRVGMGYGPIRNCRFENIVVTESRTGINFDLGHSIKEATEDVFEHIIDVNFQLAHVEQVHFSNFSMDCIVPITMTIGKSADPSKTALHDVSFTGFNIKGTAGSHIAGQPGIPIRRIRFKDFVWHLHHGTDNLEYYNDRPDRFKPNGFYGFQKNGIRGEEDISKPALPAALYGYLIEDCSFDNMKVYWSELGRIWRNGFIMDHSKNLEFRNVTLRQPQDNEESAFFFKNCDVISIEACKAADGTKTYVKITDSQTGAHFLCMNNDFSRAANPIDADLDIRESGNLYH